MTDINYMSPWRAPIEGLDLAWEMGTTSWSPRPSSTLSTSSRPKRSGTAEDRVRFSDTQEVYVGNADSSCFLCWRIPTGPISSSTNLQQFIKAYDAGHQDSDEVSWMAMGHFAHATTPQDILNHERHAVVDHPAVVHPDLIEMEVEVQQAGIEDQQGEHSSESDTDRSPSSEPRRSVLIYSTDTNPTHCRPRWATYEQLHSDLAHHMRLSSHDVTMFHSVNAVPADLHLARVHPFICQKPQDVTEGSTYQMVLLDVEFHSAPPSLEPEIVRRVKLLPQTISRKVLLAVLGLQPYCKYARNLCFVWQNSNLIGLQRRALLDIRHGDYIRVAVPPARGALRQHYTREVAQCFRKGYQASNIPTVLENYPEGFDVVDMPLIDTFTYVPRVEDLDYDRDAMALRQIAGPSCPSLDAWPPFLGRPIEDHAWGCKVAEEDLRAGEIQGESIAPPIEVGRPELSFGDIANFLHELCQAWDTYAMAEQAEDGRVLYVNTWYSDHERFPDCDFPRPVRLHADPWNWPDLLAEAWDDRVDPDAVLDIYMIRPTPRGQNTWTDAVPHVLIVQHPRPARRSVHIFAIDAGDAGTTARSFTTVIADRVLKQFFYDALGIGNERIVTSTIDCMVSHGDIDLTDYELFQVQHGYGFVVILNHLRDIIRRAASSSASSSTGATGLHLLQLSSNKKTISLAEHLAPERADQTSPTCVESSTALQIRWAAEPQPHPSYIEVPTAASVEDLRRELTCWGLACRPVGLLDQGWVVCFPEHPTNLMQYHYILVNAEATQAEPFFLHSCDKNMTPHDLMVHLHSLGFWRAVITENMAIWPDIHVVKFIDQQVVISKETTRERGRPVWPAPQPCLDNWTPHYVGCDHFESKQIIDIGVTEKDIFDLFESHRTYLTEILPEDAPHELRDAVARCDPHISEGMLDRLLIYTDGSSLSNQKHLPPQRAEEEGLGDTWAMVVIGERYDPPGIKFLGWSAHPILYDPASNMHIGAQRLGADLAEKEGLSWAGLWRLSQNWRIPTCFRSDSRVALGQAAGITGTSHMDESFQFLRGIYQANEAALGPDGVIYSHVPGHAGEVWNECCDWLAKREREQSLYCPRPNLDMRKWRKAMAHLWMVFGNHPDLPRFCGTGLHAPAPDLPRAAAPHLSEEPQDAVLHEMHFAISACSANVNSLSQAPTGHEGKIGYLRGQLKHLQLNFLGIQEAKTQEICTCVDQVYRMASGCAGRQQGVELWINLAQPYGWFKGRPCYFEKGDFQIAHKDSRIILVRVDTKHWTGWILVAYAPHSGLPWSVREDWWRRVTEITHQRKANESIIVLIDANAAPGLPDGKVVHGLSSRTSSSTPLFRSFAEEHDLSVLSSTKAHEGPSTTWTAPSGDTAYCIDFVLASQDLVSSCTLSRVVPELDLGHGAWDHEAVAAEFSWKASVLGNQGNVKRSRRIDPLQISAQKSEEVLHDYSPADWNVDIETHMDDFNAHVLHGLRDKCHKTKDSPKKPFITDAIWHLRDDKLALKARLKDITRRQREECIVAVFHNWASIRHQHQAVDGGRFFDYHTYLRCSNLRLAAAYRNKAQQLRIELKGTKNNLIRQKFEELHPEASAAQILHELRPILGPTNLKKLKIGTLPYVRDGEGELCKLPNEAIAVWSDFFRHMEGGQRMSKQEQREIWRKNLEPFCQTEFTIDGLDLPSLAALEAAYRRINPTKATGPDEIHPRFCRGAPHLLARKTYGQLMKLLTHGQESLIHKGGVLHPIWKMKGPRDLCSSYRSILVSSHIGKSLHRSLRQQQQTLFSKFLQMEQLGGRPKIPVTLGVHMGRAFLRSRRALGHNVAMLYLDLTEAFYRILRPVVIGGEVEDEIIMHVGSRLGLSTDLLADLHRHLEEPHALDRAHMPSHMQNAIKALHIDTHFQVQGQVDTCRTTLGSRPGDCFADVIFSYLWGRILHSLQDQMTQLGLQEEIPIAHGLDIGFGLSPADDQGQLTREFLGPTWMDDTCVCVSDLCPDRLERKITQASSGLLSLCESHGLTPNLQPGKSEVLLAFAGRGSRKMKMRYFGPQSTRALTLVGEKGTQQLRVVNKYHHLGCVVHHRPDNRDEARRRLGIAHQAFNQHRRHLLQNQALSLRRRRELFGTLILSRFCYGTESWTFTMITAAACMSTMC